MHPTDEGLRADDPAVGQADDRLVMEDELPPFESSPELGQELEPLQQGDVTIMLIDLVPAPAGSLGRTHRGVRVAHDRPAVFGSVRELGDADARVDEHLSSLNRERGPKSVEDSV